MNIEKVRAQFPVLDRQVAGRPVVYFDNAASSLKPQRVIKKVSRYYNEVSSNIHRGKHVLSEEASEHFELARDAIAGFLNASRMQIVFVSGATGGANTVAAGLSLAPGDNVVGTVLEHHSNLLPWKARCELRMARLLESGLPDIDHAASLIDSRTRLLTVTHCSNVTGVLVPVKEWADLAHAKGVPLFVDAAQSAAHLPIDVHNLDCDFLVCSAHKIGGPTGSGALYGKEEWLARLTPTNLGGGAVSTVGADGSYTLRDVPYRFEAGTPAIAAVLGFGVAADYLDGLGMDAIAERNEELSLALDQAMASIEGARLVGGEAAARTCIRSYSIQGRDPTTFTRILSDTYGIMVRDGHHCAHPLHLHYGVNGSVRASLQFYNTIEEVQYFAECIAELISLAH